MNKYLLLVILLLSFGAKGQIQTITYTPMGAAGYQFKYLKADSGFNIPNVDTSTFRGTRRGGSFVFDTLHRVFYGWDGIRWNALGNTTSSGIFVDSITVAGNNICQWVQGVPTCYIITGSGTFTGVDSLTYTGNSLCWWKTGIPTCYSLTPGVDSVTLVGDQLCQWKAGISTCYTIDGSLLGTFLDSVTVIGNQLCQWKAGVSTCYTINNTSTGVDSITVVDSILCAWSQGFSTCFNLNRPDTVYVADDLYVVWDSTGHQVIHRLHNDGVVSGGIVTSEGCRDLHVTPVSYYLNNGTHYISAAITLTDPAADLTLPRTDGIILDTFGLVTIRTGTPSLTPSPPSFNPASEWLLTTFPVAPGVSCLGINSIVIYDETGGTEYTPTTTGTIAADPNNTDNPEHLTKADFVVTYSDGAKMIFTKPSGNDTVFNNSVFRWGFYLNGNFTNQVQMQLFLNGVAVSNNIVVNPYFNTLDSNEYQIVGVPAYAFNLPGNTIFNKVVFTLRGNDLSGAKGFYLDWLQLQTGITNPQIDNSNKVDSVTIIDGSDYFWIKGIPHLIGTRGGTLQKAYDASIAAGDNPQINAHNNALNIDSVSEFSTTSYDVGIVSQIDATAFGITFQTTGVGFAGVFTSDSTVSLTASTLSHAHQVFLTPQSFKILADNSPISPVKLILHTDSVASINANNVAYFDGDTLKRGHISLGGSGTVTNIATGYGLSGGPITSTGTIIVDSSALSLKYLRIVDTANIRFRPVAGSNITLTGTYPNITINSSSPGTGTVTNVTATAPISITGTSTVTPNVVADTSKSIGRLATFSDVARKNNISDTASMLSPYLRKIDTTSKWVNNVTKNATNDSFYIWKGSTLTALKDSSGGAAGVTTMGAYGSTPNANGGTISGSTLTLQPADTTFAGGITTGTQLLKGTKRFWSDSIVVRRTGSGNYLQLDGSATGTSPKLTLFFAGQTANTIGASATSFNGLITSSGVEMTGNSHSIGMVNGTLLTDMTTVVAAAGSIVLQPNASVSPFINFTSNGNYFGGALGMEYSTGDLKYMRNPSSRSTFDGTEVFRVARATGGFLIGTATDVITGLAAPSSFTVGTTTKASIPAPKMTTTQRNVITTGVVAGTTVAGSGYTNGTYNGTALTGGTGTSATANITVAGNVVTVVTPATVGSGYVVGDVLSATIAGGSGFTYTLTTLTGTSGLLVYNTTQTKLNSYDGTRWTEGAKILSASATLNFASTLAGAATDLTITVTGAADGDVVSIGVPNGSTLADGTFTAWVSAANTVTIRFANNSLTLALDPASGTFNAKVFKD